MSNFNNGYPEHKQNKYPPKAPRTWEKNQEVNSFETQFKGLLDKFNLSSNIAFDANLYTVLLNLSNGVRLNKVMREWVVLNSKSSLINSSVVCSFHTTEANYYLGEFHSSNDPIYVISAADQYLMAGLPQRALNILAQHEVISENRNKKIAAFFCLSYGTALYDLRKFEDAKVKALAAHKNSKEEISICMLLANTCLHLTEVSEAIEWYAHAERNGAQAQDCDESMRNAIKTISLSKRHIVVKNLYAVNSERYKFIRGLLPKKQRSAF